MEFVKLTPSIAEEWDNLVYHSDDGWLYSLSIWQEMITSIAEWGFEDYSFAVYDNGRMVAVMPLQRRPNGVLGSTAFGAAGPAVLGGVHKGYREKLLKALFEHVRKIARDVRSPKIEVAISPLNRTSLDSTRGVNYLIHYGFQDVSTHTFIADLQRPEAELWAELSKDARRSVRLAEQAGYSVARGCWRELVDDYYRVHVETYRRTGVSPHPKAYFEGIANEIAKKGHAVLWVGRDPTGKPVAFHNCARFGQTSLYWTGCCETEHLSSGINYLLFWHALLGAKEDGYAWYEIGEAFPNVQEGKLYGLTLFKGKFGGELHRFFKGEIVLQQTEAAPVQATYRSLVRNWLKATQQLLLPLFGARITGTIADGVRFSYRIMKRISGPLRRGSHRLG